MRRRATAPRLDRRRADGAKDGLVFGDDPDHLRAALVSSSRRPGGFVSAIRDRRSRGKSMQASASSREASIDAPSFG